MKQQSSGIQFTSRGHIIQKPGQLDFTCFPSLLLGA